MRGFEIDWLGELRVAERTRLGIGEAWILALFAQRGTDPGMPVPKYTGALVGLSAVHRIAKSPGAQGRPHDPSKPTAACAVLHAAALTRGGASIEPTLTVRRGRQPDGQWLADGRLCVANAPGWDISMELLSEQSGARFVPIPA